MSVGTFRRKPVQVQAAQWTGDNWAQMREFLGPAWSRVDVEANTTGVHLYLKTLEGVMAAAPGCWIIRGVAGEFYPCRGDIFEATYEPVADNQPAPA